MDILLQLTKELGGGPAAVLLGLSVCANIWLWRSYSKQVDGRMADQKDHTAQLLDCTKVVHQSAEHLKAAMDALRRP